MGSLADNQENKTAFLSSVSFQSFLRGMQVELTFISLQELVSLHQVAYLGTKLKLCDENDAFMLTWRIVSVKHSYKVLS